MLDVLRVDLAVLGHVPDLKADAGQVGELQPVDGKQGFTERESGRKFGVKIK